MSIVHNESNSADARPLFSPSHGLAWHAGFQSAGKGHTRDSAPENVSDELLSAWFAGFSRCKTLMEEGGAHTVAHIDLSDEPPFLGAAR